jgi:hypothetical protein
MQRGLHVGFGATVGSAVLDDLRLRGCQLVRAQAFTDDFYPTSPEVTHQIAQEILDAGMRPLIIVRTPGQILDLPLGVDVEMGNEPDLQKFGWTPASYWRAVQDAIPIAQGRNPLWVGVVSNLNSRGFRFLRTLPWSEIPSWVGVSVHRYPDPGGPHRSHMRDLFGFGRRWSRDDEVRELRAIVGPRGLAISELGYHVGAGGWTEAESAAHMEYERQFWARHGFAFAVAFQIASAPSTHYEANFGFQRVDSTWRPVADAWFAPEDTNG